MNDEIEKALEYWIDVDRDPDEKDFLISECHSSLNRMSDEIDKAVEIGFKAGYKSAESRMKCCGNCGETGLPCMTCKNHPNVSTESSLLEDNWEIKI